jgi:hypothetical protein
MKFASLEPHNGKNMRVKAIALVNFKGRDGPDGQWD